MINNNYNSQKYKLTFSPRTITDALGSKIIELDAIVFAELIKNSKDANAKSITINFSNYQEVITLEDDGDGMSLEEIKNNWSVVASDNKLNNSSYLGGKGIGRFSIFKICNKITVITRKKESQEFEFSIDINDLMKSSSAEDFSLEVYTNTTRKVFKEASSKGTKIIFERTNPISLDEIFSDLKNLILEDSNTEKNLNVKYIYPKGYSCPKTILPEKAKLLAPFKCSASFCGNTLLDYTFKAEFNNIRANLNTESEELKKNFLKLDNNYSLGKIEMEFYMFFLDGKFIEHYNIDKNRLQKEFLDYYHGVSVYRKDFKIYGLGKNDWLNLTQRRVDAPSRSVNNKQIYCFVKLKSPDSDNLEEKTSREGFIRSTYLSYLKEALMLIIKQFEKDAYPYRQKLKSKDIEKWLFDQIPLEGKEVIPPEGKKVIPPEGKEVVPPEGKEVIPPEGKEVIPPEGKEVIPPESKKMIPPRGKEVIPLGDKNTKQPEKPKPKYNNSVIIDSSFIVPECAPEKFKKVVYELQTIKKEHINAQALLLRCLIDISTKHISTELELSINSNDLKGSILTILNHLNQHKLLDAKHIQRIRTTINKDNIINYFNGVAHYPDYRPDYDTVKSIWDSFEPYIKYCIEKKVDKLF